MKRLSIIKYNKEIRLIKRAALITKDIFETISRDLKPGAREKDIAKKIEYIIKKKKLKRSFKTIVASGPNAAKPHAKLTNRIIRDNDIVVVDFGVVYKGYHSDLTRTFIIGRINRKLKKIYNVVKEAQIKAINKVKEGARISDLVKSVHDYIRSKKLKRYILHSLGHGVGLKIHEAPKLSEKNKKVLRSGMVCTIEPGLYIKGIGGVRIEDMVLVKKQGCEVLTR